MNNDAIEHIRYSVLLFALFACYMLLFSIDWKAGILGIMISLISVMLVDAKISQKRKQHHS